MNVNFKNLLQVDSKAEIQVRGGGCVRVCVCVRGRPFLLPNTCFPTGVPDPKRPALTVACPEPGLHI